MEIPDELYRQVKAKSALEGRPVREVAVELFRRYLSEDLTGSAQQTSAEPETLIEGEPAPPWFGCLRASARPVKDHDLDSIRRSIARSIATERGH